MKLVRNVLMVVALAFSAQALAADPPVCKSGPESGWKSKEALTKRLVSQGLTVERIEVAGDCYAAYALKGNPKFGVRADGYYHPVSLALVAPIKS